MNLWKTLYGQASAIELSQNWLRLNSGHPLLFFGPSGVGKKQLAQGLAQILLCTTRSSEKWEACGECGPCRKIFQGIHPDVRVIDRAFQAALREEDPDKQNTIRLETVQTEKKRLSQSPVESSWKVSIIDDAHRLTPESANALLKLLEEPPAQTAIFLVTPYRDRLLPTILSRIQAVRCIALDHVSLQRVFTDHNVSPTDQKILTAVSQGSPGYGLSIYESDRWELYRSGDDPELSSKPTRLEAEQYLQALLDQTSSRMASEPETARRHVALLLESLRQLRHNVSPGVVLEKTRLLRKRLA